ncbi:hypothetical protein IYP21_001988, partial [Campylobacter jejuni]|nr:hypothetical protein [Campylobacter coli]EGP2391792.1 hypothetical protein [Campylobacter jejuni]
ITSDNIDFIKSLECLSKNAGAIFKISKNDLEATLDNYEDNRTLDEVKKEAEETLLHYKQGKLSVTPLGSEWL